LANIDAIRSNNNIDPSSPTGAALLDKQTMIGERERDIRVSNLTAQAAQDRADASYLRQAGKYAMLGGEVGAGGDILQAGIKALPLLLAL
jgi:hypothetical protein